MKQFFSPRNRLLIITGILFIFTCFLFVIQAQNRQISQNQAVSSLTPQPSTNSSITPPPLSSICNFIGNDKFNQPIGLLLVGSQMWVANRGGNNILRINISDGTDAGQPITAVGFTAPTELAFVGSQIWVVTNTSVFRFDTNGTLLGSFNIDQADFPGGIVQVGQQVWITNQGGNKIFQYDMNGNFISTLFDNSLHIPRGIALIGQQVWVVNGENNTISRFDTSGNLVDVLSGNGLHNPVAIAQVGNQVWVTNLISKTESSISRFNFAGTVSNAPLTGIGLQNSLGISVADNVVWISNSISTGDVKMIRLNFDGTWATCPTPAPTSVSQQKTVSIVDFAFTPANITINVGDQVTWTNTSSSTTHTVTSDTALWDSGPIAPGQNFSHQFTTPGIFPYHCAFHPTMMMGTITVIGAVSPTVSAPPNSTVLNFTSLLLHGIGKGGDSVNPSSSGNTNPITTERTLATEIYNNTNQLISNTTGTFTYQEASGDFKGTVDLGTSISSGSYLVKIKTDKYLKIQLPGIIKITSGQTATMPHASLIAGDANGDNQLTILDYNLLIGCYSDFSPAASCDTVRKQQTDLTDDGNVNQFDYNLMIREFSVQSGQ